MKPLLSLIAVTVLAFSGAAWGEGAVNAPKEVKSASIPFASLGGIEDWRADGTKGLYIQGRNRKWYYATFMAPCLDLPYTEHIGFVSEPSGDFDKFSSILVRHQECMVATLVTSDPPPKKK